MICDLCSEDYKTNGHFIGGAACLRRQLQKLKDEVAKAKAEVQRVADYAARTAVERDRLLDFKRELLALVGRQPQ